MWSLVCHNACTTVKQTKRGKGPPMEWLSMLLKPQNWQIRPIWPPVYFALFPPLISKWKRIPLGDRKLGFFSCQSSHRAKNKLCTASCQSNGQYATYDIKQICFEGLFLCKMCHLQRQWDQRVGLRNAPCSDPELKSAVFMSTTASLQLLKR